MYFDVLKSGENMKYELSIGTLYMLAPKWPSINGKITPFFLPKSKINPVPEETQNFQFQKNTLYMSILVDLSIDWSFGLDVGHVSLSLLVSPLVSSLLNMLVCSIYW